MNISLYFQSFFLFVFCITLILVVPFASSTTATTTFKTRNLAQNETDEVALKAFKSKIIQDPQGVLDSWNDSSHFCEWVGITCGRMHRRVTVLNLNSKGLSGSLSPYIGNLSFLKVLKLYNNNIHGEIPHDFGRLFRLESAVMFSNILVGEIPANFSHCSRLRVLSLGNNKLVGKIPSEFVSLYNLKGLSLHKNNLTGGIPSFLGNLTSLEIISISTNPFGGNIPDSLDRLKMLTYLALDSNNLLGTFPLSFYNLSSLQYFYLFNNQLHGTLPSNLGLTLPNLVEFMTPFNFFSGSIPISLSNASKLQAVDMAGNNFSGKLSIIDFGGMQDLETLYLGKNNLGSGEVDEMNFINSLANCSNLLSLSLAANKLRGVLPNSIANLSTKLQLIELPVNELYGSINPGIANLVNLNELGLWANQFTGTIPRDIGKLKNLEVMYLNDNQLSGEIPSSLGNLSLIEKVFFDDNKLSGAIPSSIGNLKQLLILNLSYNDLSGTIPETIFNLSHLSISLNMAQNHLVGSIPSNIGNLKVLTEFDVSDNNLSGEIPNEIFLCSSLEILNLEGNFFHGSIPSSLNSLRGIRQLDLSRNNLSGQIPKFLETLLLEKLNLSFNDFEGEVPTKGIFTNVSAISVVGNGNKLCGGIAELQLPKCPDNHSKKDNISLVFKILISTASVVLGLTVMSSFIFCWFKKRREGQASESTPEKSLLKVSYEMLLKATDGFSPTRLIGVGNFGSVYKGILEPNGTIIAVKVLNLLQQGASKSFMAECKTLRNIRHRNLVKVITSCSSIDFRGNDFKAIVYEFMANGSLEKWLLSTEESEEEQNKSQSLTILQRISIAIDVASAVEYLHQHCEERVLHCDLKPSNVLLDNDMTAHVGDFGLARFHPEVRNPNQSSSVGVKGTIGYAAPEYGLGNEVSTSGDVYSFGILLLEMVMRKKPTDLMFEGDLNLHSFARMTLPDRVMDIVDPVLINEEMSATDDRMKQALNNSREECLISMVRIGVACSVESPQDRMNISRVVHELQSVRKILLQATTSDSFEEVAWVNDEDFGNLPMVEVIYDIITLLQQLKNSKVCYASRNSNSEADILAKRGLLLEGENVVWNVF
ncbi:hypothetical protein LWI28_022215 [Acer negundo]|uniref:non-specific serine/threonine protein kinase n=1 Tax=Acer negundo TaxID=4023 RepID=A0AAD5IAB6_ACENE|nr:hypothetical protein LWI28_022215 [Acer negundo]